MRVLSLLTLLFFFICFFETSALRIKHKAKDTGFFDDIKNQAGTHIRNAGNDIATGVKRKITDQAVNKIGSLF